MPFPIDHATFANLLEMTGGDQAFVDELVDWSTGVPLLVVGTARTELLARRPGWGGGKPNALTISLAPLTDTDTARLVGHVGDPFNRHSEVTTDVDIALTGPTMVVTSSITLVETSITVGG